MVKVQSVRGTYDLYGTPKRKAKKVIQTCERCIRNGSPVGTYAMEYSFYYDVIELLESQDKKNDIGDEGDTIKVIDKRTGYAGLHTIKEKMEIENGGIRIVLERIGDTP